ncbi:MAG: hypothetical protein QOK37_1190 [Thermoanaerobaculia bacterium]|jgi:hypothetical protein|nr:hypothetical protein [Thermoanaerobaculia bacterium]
MKSVGSIVSTVGCLLFLAACAGNPAPAMVSSPTTSVVKVSVTGDRDISEAFARDVRDAALTSITRFVPNARPMTVSLVLDSATSGITVRPSVWSARESHTVGPAVNAAQVGAVPSVEEHPFSIAGPMAQAAFELHGQYSITDANGHLIESKPLQIHASANNRDGDIGARRDLVMLAGEFVASRVKALSH